jgi:hypothetical protein
MIPSDPALTFALTLKRWFASNGWPQKITDDWARDAGNSTGPWASQVCNAMKAAGYNPKAEFFLSLATFNQVVASQELLGITDTKLKDRLTGASPLCLENGQPYGGAEFWSLYAGLIEPPAAFAKSAELTDEDAADWVRLQRDNFRRVSLKEMCSRAEAWEMIKAKMIEVGDRTGDVLASEDLDWVQEVLAGIHDPDADELNRTAKRHRHHTPLTTAMEELLGAVNSGKQKAIV